MTVSASQYERVENEKYFTPAWVVDAVLSVETFRGKVIDPAAGAGNIMDALTAAGVDNDGYDIAPDAIHVRGPIDFLASVGDCQNIMTNPPYGKGSRLAVQFIEHALKCTEARGGKVAMLLKVGFDSAGGRRHLFADHPAFAVEYRLTKRIRWTNFDQKENGPTENHSWMLWDWRKRPGPAVKGYLPLMEITPC
jgi:hypothetical protein